MTRRNADSLPEFPQLPTARQRISGDHFGMTIRDWPAPERPREKLIARGAAALSDAELLAIFIGCGRRGHSALDIGRELIAKHGSLRALLQCEVREVARHAGLGTATACRVFAGLELGKRFLCSELDERNPLGDPRAFTHFLRARMGSHPNEVFACLFLDARHRVIAFEELFRGSISHAHVHTREVVRRCLAHNAAAVIFAHNHPSGVAEPSQDDRDITDELQEALELIDVAVLDHFIVCRGRTLSFREEGFL
jgi:DNA repair protein RadC